MTKLLIIAQDTEALNKQCVMQTDESCIYTARDTEVNLITARDTEIITARDTEVKQMAALNK